MKNSQNTNGKRSVRENCDGVSPVIAIILMVAITVVLAGVLYVWVEQLARPGNTGIDSYQLDGEIRVVDQSEARLEITHRGGNRMIWGDYKVTLNGSPVAPDSTEVSVGETTSFFHAMTASDAIVEGEQYTVRIISLEESSIIWEDRITAKKA